MTGGVAGDGGNGGAGGGGGPGANGAPGTSNGNPGGPGGVGGTGGSGGNATVTVYNPWAVDGASYDSNPYDGLLRLSITQIQECFSAVVISLA